MEWHITGLLLGLVLVFWSTHKLFRYAFGFNTVLILLLLTVEIILVRYQHWLWKILLVLGCPLMLINTVLYVFLSKGSTGNLKAKPFLAQLKIRNGIIDLENIRRGISIIGSAGSGKTESVVYGLLQHFAKNRFCGVIHDYKDFEITEMAYPLFQKAGIDFRTIAFDPIYHRVNPIAPKYLPNEESVNEVARVLIENLMEQKESGAVGSSKFFNDAAEGLLAGLIWKLRSKYPQYCTLPHLIAIYQLLDTDSLLAFLSKNQTAKAMASAFISGKDSDRQTAGVKSTLANALKKISSKHLFMALSADEVPLNINGKEKPTVVSVVNNPKFETAYSPVIATIIHTITKQMSVRSKNHSFILLEEAPTLRLLNMHRIPATLRSYDICTVYVIQDKVQNDMMYGDKASRAILSNLSYQFFGKVNDPDTARYCERFFELIKKETTSVNRGHNLNFDTRITIGEKEVSKNRADIFFKLKEGEFISYADGVDKRVKFRKPKIEMGCPVREKQYSQKDIIANYRKVFDEARSIFKPY